MSAVRDKTEYLKRLTGLDITVHSVSDERDASRIYFNVTSDGDTRCVSLPKGSSKELVNVVSAYFADTDNKSDSSAATGIYHIIKGIAPPDEVLYTEGLLSRRQYFVVLLITLTSEWTDLMLLLQTLSVKDDIIVNVKPSMALYLKNCDGAYDSSEEFADLLFKNITSDRRISLTVCSGGTASGTDAIITGYSRALTAYMSLDGNVRHYRDCALGELFKKLPVKDVKEYLDYLLKGNKIRALPPELKVTANTFMDCNLHLATAAKKMYLHRNTLAMRLDKIKEITGLDLRYFRQAQLYDRIEELLKALNKN